MHSIRPSGIARLTRLRAWLAIALALAAVYAGSACDRPKERRYLAGGGTKLVFDLRYPPLVSSTAGDAPTVTCGGTRSWLLRLDAEADGVWERTLLFNSARNAIYGCGDPRERCDDFQLRFDIGPVQRAILEGLDVEPEDFADGGVNVVCRGIADGPVRGEDLRESPLPTPTPASGSAPSNLPTREIAVTLRMLRVGESNALPFEGPSPPNVRYGAAASYSSRRFGIGMGTAETDPRGAVLFAGGVISSGGTATIPDEVWLFRPQTLTWSTAGLSLPNAGATMTATLYPDQGAEPAVLLLGGARSASILQSATASAFRYNGGDLEPPIVSIPTPVLAQAYHTAHLVPRAPADGGPIVVLFGGIDFNPVNQDPQLGNFRDAFQVFVPPGSSYPPCTVSGPFFCSSLTGTQTCLLNADRCLLPARGSHVGIYYEPTAGLSAVLVSGGRVQGGTSYSAQVSHYSGEDYFGANSTQPDELSESMAAVVTTSGDSTIDRRPIVMGGRTSNAVSSAYYFAADLTIQPLPPLRVARSTGSAVALRDRTILVLGGRSGFPSTSSFDSVERFVPLPGAPHGRFEFLSTLRSTSCTTAGSDPGDCARLIARRHGQQSVALEGTQTWLDGAVLVIGGAEPQTTSLPSTELFVPAYDCIGTEPASPGTNEDAEASSNVTLPALCDRGRAAEPLTDPETGRISGE